MRVVMPMSMMVITGVVHLSLVVAMMVVARERRNAEGEQGDEERQ